MAVVVEPLIELTLKPELEPVKEDLKISEHIATSLAKLFPELPQVADAIESTIAEKSGNTLLHHNMMHYLTLAYDNHFSVIISPDMIFYTILCELASAIKEKPDAFRFLFTNSGDKIRLTTMTNNPDKIDLNQVISGIASNIAVDASIFTADFSCSTPEARLAIQAAFCDAMSPYFFYETTRCGIPRIKVIGSQQDWLKLETKVHRMATEVFNQVGDARLTKYIFGARDTVNKMRTQTDVEFWSKIFSIERCHSGHTDLVVGWITSLFRQGTDDYYKYESHISTVEWTNIDTGNEYQMRTGLLYSHIRSEGTSDLDKQFPWLEPQFAHIILNKNSKMNPDQYRTYVTKVLKGADKKIFLGFFEVLKDEGLVIDTKGGKPETQRLEIVGRQFDYWSSHPDLPVDLNLNDDKFEAALTTYSSDDYDKEIDAVFEKLKKVFDTCQVRSLVLPDWRTNMLFKKSADMLQLLAGKSCLEELTITCMSDKVLAALNQLLTHQECRVQSLNMDARDFSAKYSTKLADALLNMKSPLKKFATDVVPDMKLANALHTLITTGTLTSISIASTRDTEQMASRVIKALIQSKTVEEVELPSIDGYDELLEQLAKAWKGNQMLKSVTVNHWKHEEKWLNMALTLPALKSLTLNTICDLKFLAQLPQLEKLEIKARSSITPVAASHIASALARGKCQMNTLIISSEVPPNALIALTAGLAINRSLKIFKCRLEEDPDEGTEELTQSFLTQQGLEEIEINGCLRAPAAQENFIKLIEEHKTIKKAHYWKKYYYDEVKWPQEKRLRKAIRDSGVAVKLLVN